MSLRSRGRRAGRRLTVNAEISVTSLVDVAFTLLVIFIITAPILQGGIDVNVPETTVRALTAEEESSIVSITEDGKIFLADAEMTIDEFTNSIGDLAAAAGWEKVYIKGDSLARFGIPVQVMGALTDAGLDWALVAIPRTNR